LRQSETLQETCGAERPSGLHSNHWSDPSRKVVGKEKPSLNNTCGGERLSDYPQQVLQGTCGAERPSGLHSNYWIGPSRKVEGEENNSP
jgi:hypothetical protein